MVCNKQFKNHHKNFHQVNNLLIDHHFLRLKIFKSKKVNNNLKNQINKNLKI